MLGTEKRERSESRTKLTVNLTLHFPLPPFPQWAFPCFSPRPKFFILLFPSPKVLYLVFDQTVTCRVLALATPYYMKRGYLREPLNGNRVRLVTPKWTCSLCLMVSMNFRNVFLCTPFPTPSRGVSKNQPPSKSPLGRFSSGWLSVLHIEGLITNTSQKIGACWLTHVLSTLTSVISKISPL